MTVMPPRVIAASLLLATTSLLSLTSAAFAQAQPIVLDPIVIEADANGQPIAGATSTAGSKTAIPVTRVPQSISVVSREQLDQSPGAKADEVLRYTAGVNPSTYGTDADTDWLFVRGFQADQTGIFLDNLPLYQFGFGTFLVDPFLLESIEVLKGPASVLYGGASVGGIVNYVSKRPTGERLRYTEAGVNNFGNGYVGFDIGDGLSDGAAAYRLTGKLSGGGYQTDYSKDLRGVVQGSVELNPTAATSLTLYGSAQALDLTHTSTGFLPYAGTAVDSATGVRIPRDLFYGEPGTDVYERQQTMIGYKLEHEINGNWLVRQQARYANVSLKEDFVLPFGNLIGSELSRYRFGHDTHVGTISVDTQLEGAVQTGALDHKVLLGFDYKSYNLDQVQSSGSAQAIDVLNPVYGSPLGALSPYINNDITMQQAGLYAQDQIKLGGVIATFNGRYDWVWTDINDHLAPAKSTSTEQGKFSGRVGLGYEFDNGLTPYVSYATSFNPTLSLDGAGKLFPAETGRQLEVGIKYEPTLFDGLITASVFNITRDNVVGPDPANPLLQAAVGEVNVRGAELEAQVKLEDFKITGALTYLEAEVMKAAGSTPVGNSPVQIPMLTASLGVDYTFADGDFAGLTIGGGVRYLGGSWADDANTTKVPAVALVDAGISYKRDDWGVALKVSNIFDTSFVSSCQSLTSCGYGAGRTATLSIHKSW